MLAASPAVRRAILDSKKKFKAALLSGWSPNFVVRAMDYFKPEELNMRKAWWFMRLVRDSLFHIPHSYRFIFSLVFSTRLYN
jgi:hypothetical protein